MASLTLWGLGGAGCLMAVGTVLDRGRLEGGWGREVSLGWPQEAIGGAWLVVWGPSTLGLMGKTRRYGHL
jgi:hypothetical protein